MNAFVRSAAVGVLATGADVAALTAQVGLLGATPLQANVPALLVGVLVQYLGNKSYAFRDRSKDHLRKGALFAAVEAGALTLNAIGYHLLVRCGVVPYALARVGVTLVVYLVFSFPLWRLIFQNDDDRSEPTRRTT